MLQTIAVMGPARINAPLTQAITAPMMGRLQARGAPWALEFAACLGLRLLHYAALMAAFVFVVLGGWTSTRPPTSALTGWLPLLPEGTAGALAMGALGNVVAAVFFSVVQVTVYRRALGRWPDGPPGAPGRVAARSAPPGGFAPSRRDARASPARAERALRSPGGRDRGGGGQRPAAGEHRVGAARRRRGVARARVVGVARRPLGRPAGRRARGHPGHRRARGRAPGRSRARARAPAGDPRRLLVAVATWMRSAAGQAGLREVFRRGLHRLGRIPAAAEAARLLEGLDAGPRLVAAGRAAAGRLAAADLRPAPMADALAAWVAGEAAGYVAGGPPAAPALRTRHRDRVLVLVAAVPVLALIGALTISSYSLA